MNDFETNDTFGNANQYDRLKKDLFDIVPTVCKISTNREHERYYLLAVIRRTLSLEKAFRQAVDSCNGQMASTLIRLNLDTLARLYALYWADETENMTSETFARDVARGKSIRNMKMRGSKSKATDRWLIQQIEGLGDWIPKVYEKTSGAIHFSDFHISQMLQQGKPISRLEDGSLHAEITIGATEKDAPQELYRELRQSFLHISLMLLVALKHRCEIAEL